MLLCSKKNHNYVHIRLSFRAINGFLNTGKGGTVFLGVEDRGEVLGIALSAYQVGLPFYTMLC